MMRRRRTFAPTLVDRLEERLAPSQLGVHPLVQARQHHASHGGHDQEKSLAKASAVVLNGTIVGQTLQGGSGTLSPLGTVTTRGTLRASGADPTIYRGKVTIIGASGSITAKLAGRVSGPSTPGAPIDLTYRITGGTGPFKGARGTGQAMFSPGNSSTGAEATLLFGAPPSTAPPPTAPPPSNPLPPYPPPVPPVKAVVLNGTVEGQTSQGASGTVDPLGKVTSSWTLTASGAEPVNYTGTVTLVGASGNITASLAGLVFGPSVIGAPINLTYTITGGTGRFKGATGSGKAVFSPSIASPAGDVALTFGNTTPPSPPVPPPMVVALNGTVQGATLQGSTGTVGPLGVVTSTGTLTASGAEPVKYSGTVTLVGTSGNVTVSLVGLVFGPSILGAPIGLTYTITGGTGAFARATGSGKAVFSPSVPSQAGEVALTFGDTPPP